MSLDCSECPIKDACVKAFGDDVCPPCADTPETKRDHDGTVEVCAHTVSFSYWNSPVDITRDVEEILEEEAESRAKEMINQGCRQGELNCLVNDDEIRGWWRIES